MKRFLKNMQTPEVRYERKVVCKHLQPLLRTLFFYIFPEYQYVLFSTSKIPLTFHRSGVTDYCHGTVIPQSNTTQQLRFISRGMTCVTLEDFPPPLTTSIIILRYILILKGLNFNPLVQRATKVNFLPTKSIHNQGKML